MGFVKKPNWLLKQIQCIGIIFFINLRSYILKGHLPKYIPPTNVKGHGINSELAKIPTHNNEKNFLIENMKKPNKHKWKLLYYI